MGLIARLSGVAAVAVVLLAGPGAAAAAPSGDGLGLTVHAAQTAFPVGDPVRMTFSVTNSTGTPCGLAKIPDGTVQITSVRRDGQELSPTLGRSFYPDSLANAIKAAVAPVEPKATVDVAYSSVWTDGGQMLRSISATTDSGGLDALWPVGDPGRYEVTAAYVVPPVDGPITTCGGTTGPATVELVVGAAAGIGDSVPVWIFVVGGAVLVLLAGLVFVLVRRRRTTVAAALILVMIIGIGVSAGKAAYADYEIDFTHGIPVPDVDFRAAVEGCIAQFSAPGGDPAGLMPRLKDKKTPKVSISPTTGESNDFETPLGPNGKGSSVIVWNPTSTEPYEDGVARIPCAALYHELQHADDVSRDNVPEGDCGDTGIKTAEVKATLTENKVRDAQHQRKQYKDKPLPKSLDECKKPKKKGPPSKGPKRLCEGTASSDCGSTNGDPHLVTFDHVYYDFQAVGEFVVARSTNGDPLEIQSRQTAIGASRMVSANTALGFRVGTAKLSMSLTGGVTELRIDGQPTTIARGDKALPGGGTLVRRVSGIGGEDGYDLRWPDGSGAEVDQIGVYGYRLVIKLAPARAGKVEGLLGDFDGDPGNDLAPPAGAPLAQPPAFDQLYKTFGDGWRITDAASLLPYGSGQNTATFTDRGFPDKPVTIDDLDADRRARAEQICRWAGVTDPWLFKECVLDVAATGQPGFAISSADTELVNPPPVTPIAAKPIASATLVAGQPGLTFDGHAGQAVFVDISASTLRDECSPLVLVDAKGATLQSACVLGGLGYISRTKLPADGKYTVEITPREGRTGRAFVRVYAAHDTDGTVQPDGPEPVAVIEQPGSIARYRFAAQAGQTFYLDANSADLPDQCSPLSILDPSGGYLNSGCVINGAGHVDTVKAKTAGTYTVVLDPVDRTVGTVRLHLYAAHEQNATISVGGPPVTATIDVPGSVARYTFTATGGTSVSLAMTDATLEDECSPVSILDPSGGYLKSGCVLSGAGKIDAVTLPVSGSYTILVDPYAGSTGKVTLTLK